MKPLFHPQLVNGPLGDPALYVEFLFERRALLFDLGDIAALAPRKVLRLTEVFVSHTHMDHFVGFDQLLRVCLGRALAVGLYGPAGFIDRVEHRLGGYTWNLVENYETDFTLTVTEYHGDGPAPRARFRCQRRFSREDLPPLDVRDGLLVSEPSFQVRAAVLDHKVPCLGFAVAETRHVNIWKNRLAAMGLPVGPWLRELKAAVLRDDPDDTPIRAWWRVDPPPAAATDTLSPGDGTVPGGAGGADPGRDAPSAGLPGGRRGPAPRTSRVERTYLLGDLRRELVRITPGQRLGYVVDVAYHPENRRRVLDLTRGVDTLFIEAAFLEAEAHLAAEKAHLTATQAGHLARAAGAKAVVPFHFSARYAGRGEELRAEAERAFRNVEG